MNGREWQPVSQPVSQEVVQPSPARHYTVPPRWLYLVAVVAIVLATALTCLVLWGFLSGFPVNATRVTAPGTTEITLTEPGTYTISYEQQVDGNAWGLEQNGARGSPVQLELHSIGSGAPVSVHQLPGDVTYQLGSTEGEAIGEFSVDRAGKYSLVSRYRNGQSEPHIVLAVARGSPNVLISNLEGFAAVILFLGGLGLGILTLILRILAKRRARIAGQSGP